MKVKAKYEKGKFLVTGELREVAVDEEPIFYTNIFLPTFMVFLDYL